MIILGYTSYLRVYHKQKSACESSVFVTQQQFCNTIATALVVIIIIVVVVVVVVVHCVKLITSFGLILFAYEWSTVPFLIRF